MTKELYEKVHAAFRKNYSLSLISFFMFIIILNASYFALSFFAMLTAKIPFFVFPLLLFYAYFFLSLVFGFHYLIFSLYSGERAFLGQLFYFFRERRMIFVSLFYLIFTILFLFLSFLPYYFFADKILDKEIYALMLAQDVNAILNLEHGFSPGFYGSLALWLFLCLFFSFSFIYLPIRMARYKNDSFFQLLSESLKAVYKGKNFFHLIAICLRSVFIPLLISVVTFFGSFALKHFKMTNVADMFRFCSVIAMFFTYLYSLYAVSAFLSEKSTLKPKIFLLPPPDGGC